MVDTAGTVLQTIALSLPAVALYMTVLNELYVKVEQAEEPKRGRSTRDTVAVARSDSNPNDDNILRAFVTVTRSMNGCDFRLATLSLFFLVASALLLVLFLAVSVVYIRGIGMVTAVVGFALLALALAYTTYASFYQLYPES
ncbi:hypothetical protein [Halolamina sp.]|jgi:hypothetical protein|uniref:hypothetical protein n=1 Tax=Halolamina sp. TaxID=1940283 RepID=UPI000677B185